MASLSLSESKGLVGVNTSLFSQIYQNVELDFIYMF